MVTCASLFSQGHSLTQRRAPSPWNSTIPMHRRYEDHEVRNDAMEDDIVVVATFGESRKVLACLKSKTGDPTGTGRGGSSIYGEKFEDEIHGDLKHTGAGILSMGPIRWITLMPLFTRPKMVWFPSSQGVGARVIKN
jgi:hypothetical protein